MSEAVASEETQADILLAYLRRRYNSDVVKFAKDGPDGVRVGLVGCEGRPWDTYATLCIDLREETPAGRRFRVGSSRTLPTDWEEADKIIDAYQVLQEVVAFARAYLEDPCP